MAALEGKRRWAPSGSGQPSGGPPKRRQPESQEVDRLESYELDAEDVDQRLVEEDLELHLGEAGRNWERPAPPPLDTATQSICKAPASQ